MTKKLRFEVFKRDKFTCQYCGKKPPEVILEVDHVVARANGGTDEIVNLVTACFDCNRGKSATPIDMQCREDIDKILEEKKERLEQLEAYYEMKKQEFEKTDTDIDAIEQFFFDIFKVSDKQFSDEIRISFKKFLKKFTIYDIFEAIEIAYEKKRYITDDTFKYLFGVLRNWKQGKRW